MTIGRLPQSGHRQTVRCEARTGAKRGSLTSTAGALSTNCSECMSKGGPPHEISVEALLPSLGQAGLAEPLEPLDAVHRPAPTGLADW
jgi:hypothetical protein